MNVQQRWIHDGLLMPQHRRRKRLASNTEPETDRVSVGIPPEWRPATRPKSGAHPNLIAVDLNDLADQLQAQSNSNT